MKDISYRCNMCRQGLKKSEDVIGVMFKGSGDTEYIIITDWPRNAENHICHKCLLMLDTMIKTTAGQQALKEANHIA